MVYHKLISGATFTDERGQLNFFNAFDMASIVRVYEIKHDNIDIIRAWQAHKNEMKWFYCHTGAFVMQLIEIDDFKQPSALLKPKRIVLEAKNPTILELSGGYATGFKAIEEGSTLQVFSDFSLNESKNDDFRYPIEKWEAEW
ncbi:dTDP-6-deoxy-3,4-keto-hexulose isomerase [Maribacter sp. ANRC-HE7]|uniref:dTDP-6-deoxy-3,4-keto-hexulose isomerase n=1 Tax=Maribacter aquimaris TaxID=2737171 RepID=A0ABR7V1Y9_9FLAO|nr:dTDP-6-deoxy-3,4-keto-hexulose isomerase [Maribacter aquimaris]MBD0778830.1 dTDP-6-deoxy-3,4-keto-hexulose isomerase [Maribacter aquimaris]